MSAVSPSSQTIHEQAAEWFARVRGGDCPTQDWARFSAWLDEDPAHGRAYAAVEDFHLAVAAANEASGRSPVVVMRRPRRDRGLMLASGGLVAAAAAFAILIILPSSPILAPTERFETAVGQTRTVTLDDGTKVALNSGTRLAVRYSARQRDVTLEEGEASFDVTHNAERPFRIAAGEDHIQVLGTEFDVLRHDGALTVTTRRGLVSVTPAAARGAAPMLVPAGRQLARRAGSNAVSLAAVDPNLAFSWRAGQAIYREARLADVAADLSRYGALPIRADESVANLRVSAVVNLDTQAAMMHRLEAFLPIKAEFRSEEVRLRSDGGAR